MKKLILALIGAFAIISAASAAEKSDEQKLGEALGKINDLLMYITETLEVTTTDVLSAENWQKDLENAFKNHFVVAKEVAKVVFPNCEEFSVTLNTKIGSGILTTVTVTSQVKCKKFDNPKPSP